MKVGQTPVPANYSKIMVDFVSSLGVSKEDLLAGTTLSLAALDDPAVHITLDQELAIYENAENLCPCPEWSLLYGLEQGLRAHGVWGYAIMTCATLAQAIDLITRYYRLGGTIAMPTTRTTSQGDLVFEIKDMVQRGNIHKMLMEDHFSSFITSLRELISDDFCFKEVSFDYAEPSYRSVYDEIFQCPVKFSQPSCHVIFDGQSLDTRIRTWDPQTHEACELQCERILQRVAEPQDFAEEVRVALLSQSCDRRSAERIAERLHISTRNLRRKLELEGTSFQKVVNSVRCELTKDYLANTHLPLNDIAELVGFADPSNLRRAFKKWTQCSPSDYREQAQASMQLISSGSDGGLGG
jgi:AraC-like DNA-binding protein